jgi:hypothetical protein
VRGRGAKGEERQGCDTSARLRHGSPFEYVFRMSKHINVNPDHYKVAGRERPGDGVLYERNKERASVEEHRLREQAKSKSRKQQPTRKRNS